MKKIVFILSLLTLFGCTQPQKTVNPSLRHMVKSDKLQLVMSKIDNVIYERQLSELDRDRRRGRHVSSLAETLRDLSRELELIESLDSSSDDSEIYKRYADLIHDEADVLDSLAQQQAYENLPDALENIKNICNSCHIHYGVEPRR